MTRDEKIVFCRIVGILLVSDLKLHDAEVRYLDDLFNRLDFTAEERDEVESSINVNDDVQRLAEQLSPEVRKRLLDELHDAAWADGVLMKSEAEIIVAVEALLTR